MSLIYGSSGDDLIEGTDDADEIFGFEGNDTVKGGKGKDKLYGGSGNDSLDGGEDDDSLYGADGNDTLIGNSGNDDIWGGDGNDSLQGGAGDDKLNDISGLNVLDGGDGNDYISSLGATTDNKLYGGNGNDTVYGGGGNDILDGGAGFDALYGGAGDDTYFINDAFDYISDTSGIDTAYVNVNFLKIPSTVEKVIYTNGAQALPYWIDALLDDGAAGSNFQQLLGSAKTWYYSFPSSLPSYDTNIDNATGWSAFTATQIARTKTALDLVTTICDFKFVESKDSSALNTLTFANNSQANSAGYAKIPSKYFFGSDVFIDNKYGTESLSDGTYGALVLIHEIGHALGLKHPFAGTDNKPPYLPAAEDKTLWTLMSYESSSDQYALNYSPLDIAALQYIYGPSTKVRTTNNNYVISQTNSNFIWDGGGTDTLDAANLTQGATLYLTPGYWGFVGNTKTSNITSAGQVTVNFGSVIENLVGSAFADKLYGSEINNVINGGVGNDDIFGGGGNDSLIGGPGNDQITGGDGIDTVQLSGNWSNYTIALDRSSATIFDKIASNDGTDQLNEVERLKFSDKSIAIDLTGNAGTTAKILGAVMGKDSLQNKTYVGIGLNLLDGGMNYSDLAALALTAIGATSNDAVVSVLWKNVIGTEATSAIKEPYIKLLTDGMKVGDLAVLAADSSFNISNINLVGLLQTGIEFLPAV
jgi:Ca2+-binding RTX toxin-like protein